MSRKRDMSGLTDIENLVNLNPSPPLSPLYLFLPLYLMQCHENYLAKASSTGRTGILSGQTSACSQAAATEANEESRFDTPLHTLRSVDASHRTATIAWMIHINIHPKPAVSVDAYSRTQGWTGNQSPSAPLGAASALIARHGGRGRRPKGTPVALVMGSYLARTLNRTSRLG